MPETRDHSVRADDLREVFDRYAAAWRARDPEAISALHTPDTEFRLRLDRPPARGCDEARETFAALFEQWPEFGFDVHRVLFGPDHWVLDWTVTAQLPEPDGGSRPVRFDCLDVVTVDGDGLVSRKDTFVDFLQVQAALAPAP